MTVFFQKISDDQFNSEFDFVVKESKNLNLIIGIFFLVLSVAAFSTSLALGGASLVLAIAAFAKTSKDQIVMKINKEGFFYFGQLITDWDHFISEEFIDDLPLPSQNDPGINDKFSLMIKYYKDGAPGYYGRKIPLTDIQDKSEEEIIAAVKFYYSHRKTIAQ